jgi:hypothetical protein
VENIGKQNPESGFKPPRAEMPTFKWLLLNDLRLQLKCRFRAHFCALGDTRVAIKSLLHAVVSSSAKHSHCLDMFPNRFDRFRISTPTT